jgi:hypothetical protein
MLIALTKNPDDVMAVGGSGEGAGEGAAPLMLTLLSNT